MPQFARPQASLHSNLRIFQNHHLQLIMLVLQTSDAVTDSTKLNPNPSAPIAIKLRRKYDREPRPPTSASLPSLSSSAPSSLQSACYSTSSNSTFSSSGETLIISEQIRTRKLSFSVAGSFLKNSFKKTFSKKFDASKLSES